MSGGASQEFDVMARTSKIAVGEWTPTATAMMRDAKLQKMAVTKPRAKLGQAQVDVIVEVLTRTRCRLLRSC